MISSLSTIGYLRPYLVFLNLEVWYVVFVVHCIVRWPKTLFWLFHMGGSAEILFHHCCCYYCKEVANGLTNLFCTPAHGEKYKDGLSYQFTENRRKGERTLSHKNSSTLFFSLNYTNQYVLHCLTSVVSWVQAVVQEYEFVFKLELFLKMSAHIHSEDNTCFPEASPFPTELLLHPWWS